MPYPEFFRWPDQLSNHPTADVLDRAAQHLRLDDFQCAEALLLGELRYQSNLSKALALLIYLRMRQLRLTDCQTLLNELYTTDLYRRSWCFLQAQYWIQTGNLTELLANVHIFRNDSKQFWPFFLVEAALLIHLNKLTQASRVLDEIPIDWRGCLESVRLRCRILERQHRYEQALDLLLPAVNRFPQNWPAQVHFVDLTLKARSQLHALPSLRRALDSHGLLAEILPSLAQIQLLRNRVADARRTALQDRTWNSVRQIDSLVEQTNLLNCYDRLGYVGWLACPPLVPSVEHKLSLDMRENQCMQLASQELSGRHIVDGVLSDYQADPDFKSLQAVSPVGLSSDRSEHPLTVAWITADLAYHPVSRFLLGLFASLPTFKHRHIVVDMCDHLGASNRFEYERLSSVEVLNLSHGDWKHKASMIRQLQPDLAIDLSGWTGGHFMRGFLTRLAPLQATYLGYFATTGLPTMDAWLGDKYLFPEPVQEWHTELIYRLNRCCFAWQPPSMLPESQLDVVDASEGGSIRFGSFNHNRKLSDATLRLWGQLISSIPGSQLVLKASHHDDEATQTLLCRRMRRQGLEPDRVIWLPRADGPVDHLRQYGLVDVALDCFPNGGCTTTCEALWMGTPVITCSGSSYVSRMSTSVLHGAGLGDWCATTQLDYLHLARAQADNLTTLRKNRGNWRYQLQTNPLGDAADLMRHLEAAFSSLAAISL